MYKSCYPLRIILPLLTFLCGLLLAKTTLATAQVPDRLIYQGDTLPLYANPLEDFYHAENPRPTVFFQGACWSTACWRGYVATWQIEEGQLYLVNMRTCCLPQSYRLPAPALDSLAKVLPPEVSQQLVALKGKKYYDRSQFKKALRKVLAKQAYKAHWEVIAGLAYNFREQANLRALFPARWQDGRVKADWFSGPLRAPKGKLLNYVHMGYMSTYEFEVVFEVEGGELIEVMEYENSAAPLDSSFVMLQATSYALAVPWSLVPEGSTGYTLTDTIHYQDNEEIMSLQGVAGFHGQRHLPEGQEQLVAFTLDSLRQTSREFTFQEPQYERRRWGRAGGMQGETSDGEFVYWFVMANSHSRVIIRFRAYLPREAFWRYREVIAGSVRLMQFSY